MFLLILGWILNLGCRLNVVSRFYRNEQPIFRGFTCIFHLVAGAGLMFSVSADEGIPQ